MEYFGLKLGQDLGNRAAHPYQEFRGVPIPPRGGEAKGFIWANISSKLLQVGRLYQTSINPLPLGQPCNQFGLFKRKVGRLARAFLLQGIGNEKYSEVNSLFVRRVVVYFTQIFYQSTITTNTNSPTIRIQTKYT